MLVFFVFFFLALFGLFAVVVDLGMARAAQVSMQTSADVAALEGLAGRDATPLDLAAADVARRQSAAAFAALVFDEDLDRSTAASEYRLGAGPVFETGVGGVDDPAGGVLVLSDPWIPALQTNEATNAAFGDLVAGEYLALDPADPGRVDWHVEANNYGRLDFAPDASGESFLARLRRTRGTAPLDRIDGVSSAGPTIPYLFGLGSGALSTDDPTVYDPRRDGITVRAAAIADAAPVTLAGLARPGFTGLAPLGLNGATTVVSWLSVDETSWIAVPIGAPIVFTLNALGEVAGSSDGAAIFGPTQIGAECQRSAPTIAPVAPPELAGLSFVTVHVDDPLTGRPRIRGFVAIQIDSATVEPGPVLRIQGVKLGRTIAPRNASAQRRFVVNAAFAAPLPEAAGGLLAPVLAR